MRGEFLHPGAALQRHSPDTASVQNKVMYISLLRGYTRYEGAAFNEYYEGNILKMSEGARQPHRF